MVIANSDLTLLLSCKLNWKLEIEISIHDSAGTYSQPHGPCDTGVDGQEFLWSCHSTMWPLRPEYPGLGCHWKETNQQLFSIKAAITWMRITWSGPRGHFKKTIQDIFDVDAICTVYFIFSYVLIYFWDYTFLCWI